MARYTKDIFVAVSIAFATYFAANAVAPRVEPTSAPAPASASAFEMSDSRYFENCSEARDAGEAPIYRGEPGYRAELDRDSDGVACEPYYGP